MRWGLFFLLILLFAIIGYGGWIFWTQYRARQAGLPPPSWKSYIPFTSDSSFSYRDSNFPSPRRGGVAGWFKDHFARLRNRRTAHGSYEEPLEGGGLRGRGADRDEIWDARMGADHDTAYGAGGYYEEQELGMGPRHEPYEGMGYGAPRVATNVAPGHDDVERGRSRSREPASQAGLSLGKTTENPFGDNAEPSNMRDMSPRPEADSDSIKRGRENSPTGKRSAFRESL